MPNSAELVKIADAITTELAAAQVAGLFVGLEAFTPERNYADWTTDIEELDARRIDVVPVTYEESKVETRGSVKYLCTVDVAVRRWFPVSMRNVGGRIKPELIDRLVLFVQELDTYFCQPTGRRLAAYDDAFWEKTKMRFAYSRKHLSQNQMFLGIVRVGYSVSVAL